MEKNSTVDFKALEKELQAALAADEKYKRENAAKLRAVAQRVPSYEDFRNIVLASHLKPLEQKDKMGGKRAVCWNCHAAQGKTSQEDVTIEISQRLMGTMASSGLREQSQSSQISPAPPFPPLRQEETPFQPRTSAEFYRDWRRRLQSGPERYQALLQLGGPTLGCLFQTDVGFGLLGELLVTLADHVRPADQAAVLEVLRGLAGTGRFPLNLSLLSPAEREGCRALFQKLQAMGTPGAGHKVPSGEEQGLLQELWGLYQVH